MATMNINTSRPFTLNEPPSEAGPVKKHAVEKIQLNYLHRELKQEEALLGITFGSFAPFQRQMERTLLAQVTRLPGLPSSLCGLRTVMDMDETIEFEDYLNLAENAPEDRDGDMHAIMQARFNM
eukprot:GEMP01081356.1.p1 GENE.GEMP01081356.1~~GEMP01081356.1.p1  ORF type:complete len:124 (+),score=47.59 GEMP01081356.1:70-441(+)